MNETNHIKYIQPFIDLYKNDPKYISNEKIEEYLQENELTNNQEAINAFIDLYNEIGAKRYILQKYVDKLSAKTEEKITLPDKYEDYIISLKLRKYSPRTIKIYTSALRSVNTWIIDKYNVSVDQLTQDIALKYFLYLVDTIKASYSTVRIHRFSVEYYFLHILKRNIDLSFMNKMRKGDHLPMVLTHEEILQIIKKIVNIKHRLMISLLYSSGLRVSEVVNLKVANISLENLTLIIKQGKGKKDRLSVFSENLKGELNEIIDDKEAQDYLFTSDFNNKEKLTVRTVQNVFKKALRASGIKKDASCHDLRHSFASHLLENGTDIRHIQVLLGHKNISTTTIYTRVAVPALKGIRSPL
jgi:integrase/recombinase XerD